MRQDLRQMLDAGLALRGPIDAEQTLELRLELHRLLARRRDREIFQVPRAGCVFAGHDDAESPGSIEPELALLEDPEGLIDRHGDLAAVGDDHQAVAIARPRTALEDVMDVG